MTGGALIVAVCSLRPMAARTGLSSLLPIVRAVADQAVGMLGRTPLRQRRSLGFVAFDALRGTSPKAVSLVTTRASLMPRSHSSVC